MSKDYKRLLGSLGIIFLSVLLSYKLPRDSYSTIQYLIKPIRFESSALYLSGVIPLIMLFSGVIGLSKVEWFAKRSKILIFLVVIIFVLPIMRGSLDLVKGAYLSGLNGELRSIDFKDTSITIQSDMNKNEATLQVKLVLTDYGENMNNFKIRMNLPDSLKSHFNTDSLEFDETYKTFGNRHVLNIDKAITVHLTNGSTAKDIFETNWDWDTFRFQLYNESNSSELIYHGI